MASLDMPDIALSFTAMLKSLHSANFSHWFRIVENEKDVSTEATGTILRTKYIKQFKGDKEKAEDATLKHLKELDMMLPMSLHRHLEISQAEFHSIMQKCGIMKNEVF
jgi:hypothetical protein